MDFGSLSLREKCHFSRSANEEFFRLIIKSNKAY